MTSIMRQQAAIGRHHHRDVTVAGGGGGGGEPSPGGTIVYDQRAGGPKDLAQYTNYGQTGTSVDARFNAYDGNDLGNIPSTGSPLQGIAWTTNLNSDNKHSPRFDYKGSISTDPEQDNNTEVAVAVSGQFFAAWKMRLGKTSTSGGNGAVGQFQLLDTAPNSHIKSILFLRSDSNRIYHKLTQGFCECDIDNNNFVSNQWDLSTTGDIVTTLKGTELIFTQQCIPSSSPAATDGVLRIWLNHIKILDQTNCLLGNGTLTAIQTPATFLVPGQDCSIMFYDLVVWH